jgi:transcriptional regulator with XRE-family HTH domain
VRARCNLAHLRGDRSIAEMARAADIPRPYLSQIEAGIRLPSDAETKAIARAYGATLEQMYVADQPHDRYPERICGQPRHASCEVALGDVRGFIDLCEAHSELADLTTKQEGSAR